jgi:hypothetical protein
MYYGIKFHADCMLIIRSRSVSNLKAYNYHPLEFNASHLNAQPTSFSEA